MKKIILISLCFGLISVQCNSQKSVAKNTEVTTAKPSYGNQQKIEIPNTLELSVGDQKFMKFSQTNVLFEKIISDNRCPEAVECIQAGNVIVGLELMSTTSRPSKIQLAMRDDARLGVTKSYYFSGYTYQLVRVSPSSPSNSEKYKIVLKIEKASPEATSILTK